MAESLPGYNIELVKKKIRELQEKYEKDIKPNESDYNEANTKKGFIEPILRILNWDTEDINQVDAEFPIKNKRSSGSADYALKIDGEIKLLLEAKSFDKDLETGYDVVNGQKRTYVEQLVGYAFDLNRHMKTKIDYCILTNGKEWRVYNVQWQGIAFDKKLVFVIKIEEFLDKFIKFWSLEKGNVAKRDIDRYVLDEDKVAVDRKAVSSLLYCKKLLIDSIVNDYENNKRDMKYVVDKIINEPIKDAPNGFPKFHEMPEDERLNKFVLEASSNVINKILFIRIIEDKGYLKPKLTKRSVEEWKSWFSQADRILRLFREACHEADQQYNGGIFDVNPYDTLNYDNEILDKIISILGDFNFEEIDADVIGRIYEIYLGTVLSVEEEIKGKKRTKLSADFTERKKLGQYYTPKFVVDYIVKNTLGKLLEGKTPEEVSKIKVLDPACGSGSFLIRAFDYLKDYYVRYNDQQMSKVKQKGTGNMNNYIENGTIIDYNHRILKDNLHGVDLNDLSTQICSINLWLRALEKDKKLEKLSKNILHGNSLISGVENKEELAKYKDELKEIAELREKIKDYYGRDLKRKEQDELNDMEEKLRKLRQKINIPLNENLKEYFDNLDLIYPFNWGVEFTEVFDPEKLEEEQGFDVVIGNPPYVSIYKISEDKNVVDFFQDSFEAAYKKFDLYVLFIERSIKMLKEGGYFSFIIPDKWMYVPYGERIRKLILDNCKIEKIIDLTKFKIFENAVVDNVILILQKESNPKKRNENKIEIIKQKENPHITNKINESGIYIIQNIFNNTASHMFRISLDETSTSIIKKIEKHKIKLKDILFINRGLTFGADYYKKCDKYKKQKELIKNFIKGKNISKWAIKDPRRVIIKKEIMTYLPFEELFLSKKIIIPKIKGKVSASLDENGFYIDSTGICCVPYYLISDIKSLGKNRVDTSKKYKLEYLLGLINSKLNNFYFNTMLSDQLDVVPENIAEFIVFPATKIQQDKISEAVERILKLNEIRENILKRFNQALNNQPIPDEKDCKFEHYWKNSNLYDISKETIPFANKTKAKILDMKIEEDNNKLIIYTTNVSLVQNKKYDNIKTIELTVKNETLRKFLFYSFKKYINEKKGRGFGSGIILDVINKIPIPVYIQTVKTNLQKIKDVMDEFEHETKDLWKIHGKTYKTLTEIEEDIKKTDNEIDEMVYKLYGITEEEKKIIEESLK